jgi:hypothetical protein
LPGRRLHQVGGQNGLEQLGSLRELPTRDRRVHHGRNDGQRLLERLLLNPQAAEKRPRRLGVGVELDCLLGRAHRFRALAHFQLRLGEERQAFRGARRGLQDGNGRVPVLLREQRADEIALRLGVAGRKLERLLKDLGRLVVRSALQQHRSDQAVLHYRLVLLVGGAVQVGEPDLDAHVRWVDPRHLLVDGDGVDESIVFLIVIGEDLVLAAGILNQPLLVVQIGEPVVDLELSRVDLVDLLEDRNRLQEEAVLRVGVGDPGEEGDRLPRVVHPDVQVAHLVERRDVLRIVLEDAEVLLDRLVELAPCDELLGRLEDLFAVNRHRRRF